MKLIDRIKRMGKFTKIAIAVIVLLIIGIRIALPYVILHYASKSLANLTF